MKTKSQKDSKIYKIFKWWQDRQDIMQIIIIESIK